jgi:chromosome partitioning protein
MPGSGIIGDLWSGLQSNIGKGVAGILATAFLLVVGYLLKEIWCFLKYISNYYRRIERVRSDIGREQTPVGLREGKGLWLAEPLEKPDIDFDPVYGLPKVLVIANAKGGVGKTTVAASLGGCLAENAIACNERPVLMIDLDFQGSLSSMSIVGENNWLPNNGMDSEATYLISGDRSADDVASTQKTATVARGHAVEAISKLKLITSYYDLAQAENRVLIEWLLSNRKKPAHTHTWGLMANFMSNCKRYKDNHKDKDIRFRLQELLHSNVVRQTFGLIIIDCPPRLTTGTIQAIAAGTHMLIPTKLDKTSTEAVVTFVRQIEIFRKAGLCPNIDYIGVVGTMVPRAMKLDDVRYDLDERLKMSWKDGGGDNVARMLPTAAEIVESVAFRDAAGKGIAYLGMGDNARVQSVKRGIRNLASVVAEKMGLPYDIE